MRTKSHYANALSNWTALGLNALLAFVMTPIIIQYIGQEGYGLWVILMSIVGYYGFLDMGITTALLRYIARYAAQGKHLAVNEIINTALAIFCTIGIVIIVFSFSTASYLPHFFNVVDTNADNFVRAIQLLSFAIFLRFIAGVFRCTLLAHEYFIASNSVEILCSFVRAGVTFFLLYKGWGLYGIAVSHTIAASLMALLHFSLCKRFVPTIRLQFNTISRETRNRLLTFGGVTVIISATDIIRLNLDSFIIAKMIDLASVSIYAVAALLINNVRQLVISAVGIFNPRFAALEGQGNKEKLIQLFLQSLFICGLISFSLSTTLVLFGGDFIRLWVGYKFSAAIPVLIVLAIGTAVAVSQCVSLSLMYAMKKHKWYAIYSIIEAIFNILLSVFLAQKYGVLGVAFGTAIPMVCISGIIQPFYVSRLLNISVLSYIAYLIPGVLIGVSAVAATAYLSRFAVSTVNYFSLGGQVLASLAMTILLLLFISKKYTQLQQLKPWRINISASGSIK